MMQYVVEKGPAGILSVGLATCAECMALWGNPPVFAVDKSDSGSRHCKNLRELRASRTLAMELMEGKKRLLAQMEAEMAQIKTNVAESKMNAEALLSEEIGEVQLRIRQMPNEFAVGAGLNAVRQGINDVSPADSPLVAVAPKDPPSGRPYPKISEKVCTAEMTATCASIFCNGFLQRIV